MAKNIKVTKESPTGRNKEFRVGNRTLTRAQLSNEINAGKHKDYHVRKINGLNTPVSNPDGNESNNLG